MMMQKTVLAIGLLSAALLSTAGDAEVGTVVRLSPAVNVQQPDNDYSRLPCEALANAKAESAAQQQQLRERRQQCLDGYRQFLPGTGLR